MQDHPMRRRVVSIVVLLLLAAGGFLIVSNLASPNALTAAEDAPKDKAGGAKAKGGGGSPGGAPQGPPPALIRVGMSAQAELQPRFTVIGRFKELKRTIVGSGQQGRVIEMNIEEGQAVEENKTILARIDQTFSKIEAEAAAARLLEAKAAQAEAQANLDQATRDRTYYEELEKTQSAKPREVDNSRSTERANIAKLERAKAAVVSAEQDIERVREELVRFNVIAPFNGVVVRKWMERGQWVQKGAPVVELVSRGEVDAVVDVPEKYVNSIYDGEEIEMLVDALNITVTGKIQAIIPDGTNAARTFPVKIRVDDQKGKLKPGMSMTAWIPTGEKEQLLTVPRDAVLVTVGSSVVWVVVDGKALKVDVDVLFGAGDQYAVRTARRNVGPPLAPGMQVVIEGGERLMFPGQPVVISQSR